MRTLVAVLLGTALGVCAQEVKPAQKKMPVVWSLGFEPASAAPGAKVMGKLTGKIDAGWHVYSLTTPEGGGIPATVKLADNPVIASTRTFQPKPESKFDPNFNANTERFDDEVVFLIEVQLAPGAAAGPADITANIRYSACTDRECLPPRRVTASASLIVDPKATATAPAIPPNYVEFTGQRSPAAAVQSQSSVTPAATSADEIGPFLLLAFGFGLASIFTPCVFPMIPITLSFFLNRPGTTRGASIRQAALFCLGIIILFSVLGLSIAALVGPFGVVQLGSNPWVNGFIALVFLAFGLSLLGAFELTLPSGLLTRMNAAADRGGILGTLLMGLTFSLTSFACIGPFMGTLLAGSVQSGGARPLLGMATFASGLALPFFVLALFPAYLQRMPRSGGWLSRVKVVLGFVVLAWMLKYVSSIDQVLQWNILTRERFLAAWFVMFLLPGLYLLGFLRMEGIDQNQRLGVGRTLSGAAFLIFALSLIPGMFGGRLGELDSYVPLASSAGNATGDVSGLRWIKNDYRAALAQARDENKLLFVSFTGYACTNCHWMKANMFTRAEVAGALNNFVLIELYTDGTDAASEENQKLQETRFNTVAIPFYAIMTPTEQVVATSAGLTRNTSEYLAFLRSGAATQSASVQ